MEIADSEKIRRSALNALARRDHTRSELQKKLRAKAFAENEIEAVLQDFENRDYLNETRFVQHYIEMRAHQGLGPLRIMAELKQRGISALNIAQFLDIADNSWHFLAHEIWKKRFKNQYPSDDQTKAKQVRFLQYRGFTSKQIDGVFLNQTKT